LWPIFQEHTALAEGRLPGGRTPLPRLPQAPAWQHAHCGSSCFTVIVLTRALLLWGPATPGRLPLYGQNLLAFRLLIFVGTKQIKTDGTSRLGKPCPAQVLLTPHRRPARGCRMRDTKRHKRCARANGPREAVAAALPVPPEAASRAGSSTSGDTCLPEAAGQRAASSVASISDACRSACRSEPSADLPTPSLYIGGSHCPLDGWYQACRRGHGMVPLTGCKLTASHAERGGLQELQLLDRRHGAPRELRSGGAAVQAVRSRRAEEAGLPGRVITLLA